MRVLGSMALAVGLGWAQGLKYLTDIEAAFQQAKKTKKPLWVMVSATWCGPCRWTEKEVLTRKWFDSLISPHFIPLKVYAASGEGNTPKGEELANKYRIRVFPTFLFLYPSGEIFYRTEGTPTGKDGDDPEVRQEWQETIQKALMYKAELPTLRQKFEKGDRSPEIVRRYFIWALKAADSTTLHKAWEAYLAVFPSPRLAWLYEPEAYRYLLEAALRLPAAKTYALEIADTLRNLLPPKIWEGIYRPLLEADIFRLLSKEINLCRMQKLPESQIPVRAVQNTLAQVKKLQERFPFAEAIALLKATETLLRSEGDEENRHHQAAFLYASQYVATVKTIGPPDADERSRLANNLNSLAWEVYENIEEPAFLWAAVSWTKDALSYEPDDWYIWDTLGALYYKLKRKKEAIEALSKAIALARAKKVPESEYKSTLELLEKAEALE